MPDIGNMQKDLIQTASRQNPKYIYPAFLLLVIAMAIPFLMNCSFDEVGGSGGLSCRFPNSSRSGLAEGSCYGFVESGTSSIPIRRATV